MKEGRSSMSRKRSGEVEKIRRKKGWAGGDGAIIC